MHLLQDESSAHVGVGGISAARSQAFIGEAFTRNAHAAWTAGMAAAVGFDSDLPAAALCQEVNADIVSENMVFGFAREMASSMHGDSAHQKYIKSHQDLVGRPSTTVSLPNGQQFSTLQLNPRRSEHRATNNRLEGVGLFVEEDGAAASSVSGAKRKDSSGNSNARKKKWSKADSLLYPGVVHQHAVPAAIQRSRAQHQTPSKNHAAASASKVTPLSDSSSPEHGSQDKPIALDFSQASPMGPQFEFGSPPVYPPSSPVSMLDRMMKRSLRDSGAVSVYNIETGKLETIGRNNLAKDRFKLLNNPESMQPNLNILRHAKEINPLANSQDMCATFDELSGLREKYDHTKPSSS
jgi:hypothetical protein